jgi:hypothetical protein
MYLIKYEPLYIEMFYLIEIQIYIADPIYPLYVPSDCSVKKKRLQYQMPVVCIY